MGSLDIINDMINIFNLTTQDFIFILKNTIIWIMIAHFFKYSSLKSKSNPSSLSGDRFTLINIESAYKHSTNISMLYPLKLTTFFWFQMSKFNFKYFCPFSGLILFENWKNESITDPPGENWTTGKAKIPFLFNFS